MTINEFENATLAEPLTELPARFLAVVQAAAVVAVEALPLRAPENVVVESVAVEGLNVIFELETFTGRFPVVVVTHVGYIVALVVVSSVIAEFVAFVAVVAVVAFPLNAPENVLAVIVYAPAFQLALNPRVPSAFK